MFGQWPQSLLITGPLMDFWIGIGCGQALSLAQIKERAHGGIRTQLESVALVSFPGLGCGMLAGRGRFTSVMENSGKKLPKKRGGVAGKNPGSESHPRTTESAQYGSAVHEAKTSGIVSNEHFIKREWLTLFRAADSRCGIQCAVAAIFVHISSRNTLMIPEIPKRSQCFAQSCKLAQPARICIEPKMLPSHISIICMRLSDVSIMLR